MRRNSLALQGIYEIYANTVQQPVSLGYQIWHGMVQIIQIEQWAASYPNQLPLIDQFLCFLTGWNSNVYTILSGCSKLQFVSITEILVVYIAFDWLIDKIGPLTVAHTGRTSFFCICLLCWCGLHYFILYICLGNHIRRILYNSFILLMPRIEGQTHQSQYQDCNQETGYKTLLTIQLPYPLEKPFLSEKFLYIF